MEIDANLAEAQIEFAELKSLAAKIYVPAYNYATIYNALNAKDEALNYLEKASGERAAQMSFIKIDLRRNNRRALSKSSNK